MAKGKDKGDKAKKKVTKQLKKAGDAAVKLAQQPVVGELVAAALTAAAASLTQTRTVKKAAQQTGDAAEGAMRDTAAIGQQVKRALLDAARSLLDDFDDRPRESTLSRSDPETKKPPKKTAAKSGGKAARKPKGAN